MILFDGGFSFSNFLADLVTIFVFVLWFWLLIVVLGDLVRRDDRSGWVKALWVVGLVVAPYIGVFAYLIVHGSGMAERNNERALRARDELRYAIGFCLADEIEKLDRVRKSGMTNSCGFARAWVPSSG